MTAMCCELIIAVFPLTNAPETKQLHKNKQVSDLTINLSSFFDRENAIIKKQSLTRTISCQAKVAIIG